MTHSHLTCMRACGVYAYMRLYKQIDCLWFGCRAGECGQRLAALQPSIISDEATHSLEGRNRR